MTGRLKSMVTNMSLKGKMFLGLTAAALVSMMSMLIMFTATTVVIEEFFADESHWKELTDAKADELQVYITDNELTTEDKASLRQWNKRNPGVYIYIYDPDDTIYETAESIAAYSYENYRSIVFADRTVDMSIFYALDYRYYSIAVIAEIVIAVLIFLYIAMRMVRQIVIEIKRLENDIKILEGGGLDHVIEVHGGDEIGSLEKSLDEMRIALKSNIEREDELARANNELVARMAHDLRTPLTSLLLYLDLIENRKYDNEEQLNKYVNVARDKASRIKFMSDQLFERFLITGEKYDVCEAPERIKYILEDPLSVLVMTLEEQGFTVYTDFEWPEVRAAVSTSYVSRIIDNIQSNLIKYADRDRPVIITVSVGGKTYDYMKSGDEGGTVDLRIINYVGARVSSEGGSNIGLGNIDIMMHKMNGSLEIIDDNVTFEMILRLPAIR